MGDGGQLDAEVKGRVARLVAESCCEIQVDAGPLLCGVFRRLGETSDKLGAVVCGSVASQSHDGLCRLVCRRSDGGSYRVQARLRDGVQVKRGDLILASVAADSPAGRPAAGDGSGEAWCHLDLVTLCYAVIASDMIANLGKAHLPDKAGLSNALVDLPLGPRTRRTVEAAAQCHRDVGDLVVDACDPGTTWRPRRGRKRPPP